MNRRTFLQKSLIGAAVLGTGQFPFSAVARQADSRLVILHTNDTHSRIEPFPDTDKNFAGLGGVSRRADVIRKIRRESEHVLLLDAGDFLQGTPYFNMYRGEVEVKAMNYMEYDACTFGNHEFDVGMERLGELMHLAQFPFINCNYDFSRTNLKGMAQSYKIFQKGPFRVGVLGVGIALYGLASKESYGRTWVNDALVAANKTAGILKKKKGCNLVVCLSHLGYDYNNEKYISDIKLAQASEDIDLIIGGHTHTFLDVPVLIKNKKGQDVIINQMGWGGTCVGQIEYRYASDKKIYISNSNTVFIGK